MHILMAGLASLGALFLALPVLIISSPFWLVGAGQRIIERIADRLQGKPVRWEALMEYEPIIGWRPKPNVHARVLDLAGNQYSLTTGPDGWRSVNDGAVDPDIFVFGDSFAFGFGADDRHFFANLAKGLTIKPVGANGYNMVQEFLLMQRYADALAGRLVIWFVYHGNDLLENLTPNMQKYRMPFVRKVDENGSWEIVTRHVSAAPWSIGRARNYYAKLAEICSDSELAIEVFSACDFLIGRGKELCDSFGARLVLVSLPDVAQLNSQCISTLAAKSPHPATFDAERPDHELRAICGRHGVEFHTTKAVLGPRHFIKGDVHWNKEGSRVMAKLIQDIVAADRINTRPRGAV